MEFIQGLQELLKKQRFQRVDDDSQIVWIREEENVSAMIMIVPERLPGRCEGHDEQGECNYMPGKGRRSEGF